jgi:hypothetical protein
MLVLRVQDGWRRWECPELGSTRVVRVYGHLGRLRWSGAVMSLALTMPVVGRTEVAYRSVCCEGDGGQNGKEEDLNNQVRIKTPQEIVTRNC